MVSDGANASQLDLHLTLRAFDQKHIPTQIDSHQVLLVHGQRSYIAPCGEMGLAFEVLIQLKGPWLIYVVDINALGPAGKVELVADDCGLVDS